MIDAYPVLLSGAVFRPLCFDYFLDLKKKKKRPGIVVHAFNPSIGKQKQAHLYEASLVCTVGFRTAEAA